MYKIKEHMIIWEGGVILVAMNVIKMLMSLVHKSVMSVIMPNIECNLVS